MQFSTATSILFDQDSAAQVILDVEQVNLHPSVFDNRLQFRQLTWPLDSVSELQARVSVVHSFEVGW